MFVNALFVASIILYSTSIASRYPSIFLFFTIPFSLLSFWLRFVLYINESNFVQRLLHIIVNSSYLLVVFLIHFRWIFHQFLFHFNHSSFFRFFRTLRNRRSIFNDSRFIFLSVSRRILPLISLLHCLLVWYNFPLNFNYFLLFSYNFLFFPMI